MAHQEALDRALQLRHPFVQLRHLPLDPADLLLDAADPQFQAPLDAADAGVQQAERAYLQGETPTPIIVSMVAVRSSSGRPADPSVGVMAASVSSATPV